MLVSPIKLFPAALPDAKVQEIYYRTADSMPTRIGPRVQQRERVKETVALVQQDYVPTSALIASPLIFQKRSKAAASGCEIQYSLEWTREQSRKTLEQRCSTPYTCTRSGKANYTNLSIDAAIPCPSKQVDWEGAFLSTRHNF